MKYISTLSIAVFLLGVVVSCGGPTQTATIAPPSLTSKLTEKTPSAPIATRTLPALTQTLSSSPTPSSPTESSTKNLIIGCDPSRGGGYYQITDIYIANVDGSQFAHLNNFSGWYGFPVWSPNGTRFAVVGSSADLSTKSLFVINADGSGLINVANNVDNRVGDGGYNLTWSPDSARLAFASSQDGQIYLVNADGSGLIKVSNNTSYNDSPAWSPDGARIAFVARGKEGGQIFVMNVDGSEQIQLTQPPSLDHYPVWLPDSKQIIFYRSIHMAKGIMLVNIDHPNPVAIEIGDAQNIYRPFDVLSDGRVIYSSDSTMVYKDSRNQILSFNLPETRSPYLGWSPDGTEIAYVAFDNQVYITNVDGSGQLRLTNDLRPGCFFFAWQPSSSAQ